MIGLDSYQKLTLCVHDWLLRPNRKYIAFPKAGVLPNVVFEKTGLPQRVESIPQ